LSAYRPAAALVILLAGLLAGCVTNKQETLMPTTVGVVTSVEPLAGRTVVYHLSSGKVLEVDLAAVNILAPGGPGEGDLLLSGAESSGRTWIAGLFPYVAADAPSGCFRLAATGIGEDGWIDLSIGVRLRKASNFDPGPISNDRYVMERLSFCINGDGEVLSYG
jgi:hypothetical protein